MFDKDNFDNNKTYCQSVLKDLQELVLEQSSTLAAITKEIETFRLNLESPKPQVLYANSEEILLSSKGLFLAFPNDQLNHALSFLNPMFDQGLFHFLSHSIGSGSTYVDVGANIGTLVGLAAKNTGHQGKVVAIEPIVELEHFIRRNAFLNGPLTPINVHSVVAGSKNGTSQFQIFNGDNRISTKFPYEANDKRDSSNTMQLKQMQMHSLIPATDGDLVIKIDAEGSEFEILVDLFNHHSALRGRKTTIVFEYALEHITRAGHAANELLDLLTSHGLEAYFIHPLSGSLGAQLQLANMNDIGNVAISIPSTHFSYRK